MEPSSKHSRQRLFTKVLLPSLQNTPTCPVCLHTLHHRSAAITTTCLHAYCFRCIHKWSNVKRNCPLCNSNFHSLYLDFDVLRKSFRERKLPHGDEDKRVISRSGFRRRERQRRLEGLRDDVQIGNSRTRPLPWRRTFGRPGSVTPDVVAERKLQWRASIYNRRLQAVPMPSRNSQGRNLLANSGMKEVMLRRIEPWVRRELQAILGDPDPSIIVHVATSLFITSLERVSTCPSGQPGPGDNFLAPLQPFLHDWTSMFWHELRCFGESSLNMDTYDAVVEYKLME